MTSGVDFEEDAAAPSPEGGALVLDLEGFEGPIDVLLQLARDQKVDLTQISILQLAEQYLEFVRQARRLRLELAADYLVMAAWLAYLKSRLLLPEPEGEDEPTGAEMAAALAFQLQRLEAMQTAGQNLMKLPQLGQEFFARGAPERIQRTTNATYDVSLYELLSAYGRVRGSVQRDSSLRVLSLNLYSVEDAMERLRALLGDAPGWRTLSSFLPADLRDSLMLRSAVATTFSASLEMVKSGKLQLRQDAAFGPIYLRRSEKDVE
ncbi:MAG: ScpA family protein [Rhodovibrionaceae bacterium]